MSQLSAELAGSKTTRTAEEFHRLASACKVVELPKGFSALEAGGAGQDVLRAVTAAN